MLNPGDSFGDYRVIRLLGKGGMGSVFLLENDEGSEVAAKILDPESSGDEESRKRFLREAQLALGVKHPNLVETYDVGEDPDTGLCYILMEYVPGGSLADKLRNGPLPVNEAIRIVYQIASVLELARQKGVVHRDIKPDNIMFGADGKAKLADLGIARGGVGGVGVTTVTQTGMMIGTPAYMAPEQMLDAHNVDSRADIYSLGIVFYEMLAGKRPNADDTVVQLMAKAVAGEPIPDVRTMRPEISAAVAELISLMCAIKTDERIATPVEVTTALSQIVHGREVTIRRKRPMAVKKEEHAGGGARFPVAAVIIGFLAVAGVAAWYWQGRSPVVDRPTTQPPVTDVPATRPAAAVAPAKSDKPDVGKPMPPEPGRMEVQLGDGVTMSLVKCPAGTFTMGYADSTWPSHRPHEVKISRPFWIGRTPVTVAEWLAFDKTYELKDIDRTFGHRNIGVGRLTMERIHAYCAWLTEKHGSELPPGYVFRLPTDAEWEYACKAGSKDPDDAYVRSRFKAIEQERAVAAKLGDKIEFFKAKGREDAEKRKYDLLWPVATKRPNAWGICDLIGHVAEPVLDTYPPVDNASGTVLRQAADAVHLALPAESTDPLAVCTNADRVALMRASVELGQQRTGAAKKWRMWWSCAGCEGFRVVAGPDLLKERGVVFAPHAPPARKPTAKELPYSAGKATGPTPKDLSIALPQGHSLEFVGCPPGEFTMGYVNDRNDSDWYRPHQVTISRPFWMLKHPVSCDQWAALAPLAEALRRQDLGEAAVWGMTFAEMGAYCRELTKRLPKGVPRGYVVRLPTEAEWEYALKANALDENDPHCRSTRKWRGDEEAMSYGAVIDGASLQHLMAKGVRVTTPVERSRLSVYRMKANRWGVHGMSGASAEPMLDTYPVLMAQGLYARFWGDRNHPLSSINYPDHAVDPLAFCADRPCSRLSRGGGNMPGGMATKRFDALQTVWGGRRYGAQSAGQYDYNRGKLRLVIGPDLLKERGQVDVDLEGLTASQAKPLREGHPARIAALPSKTFNLPHRQVLALVGCPEGRFTMGNPKAPQAWTVDAVHEVRLTRPFWIGSHPVTREQWSSVMNRVEPNEFERALGGLKAPVTKVTRGEALEFCEQLTRRFRAKLPKGYVFRLPTDAEWEYALRGGSSDPDDPHVMGNAPPELRSRVAVLREDKLQRLRQAGLGDRPNPPDPQFLSFEVRTKRPNAWGIYDMLGNVDELLMDTFPIEGPDGSIRKNGQGAADACTYAAEETDPFRRYDKSDGIGMVRAISDSNPPGYRRFVPPSARVGAVGFRVVLGPDLEKEQRDAARVTKRRR